LSITNGLYQKQVTNLQLIDGSVSKTYIVLGTCSNNRFLEVGIVPSAIITIMDKRSDGSMMVNVHGKGRWAIKSEELNCVNVIEKN